MKILPHLEITEVVLILCNIVNNEYQEDSRVLYKSVPNKSFGLLLDISPKNFIFLKTFDLEFSYIKEWFTDQNSKSLEVEDKKPTQKQNQCLDYLIDRSFQGVNRLFVLSFEDEAELISYKRYYLPTVEINN